MSAEGPAGVLLTPRQREVCAFVARGLTNEQIARDLTLSRRTVETHVHRILKRLRLRSRSQIVAWAREHLPEDAGR